MEASTNLMRRGPVRSILKLHPKPNLSKPPRKTIIATQDNSRCYSAHQVAGRYRPKPELCDVLSGDFPAHGRDVERRSRPARARTDGARRRRSQNPTKMGPFRG